MDPPTAHDPNQQAPTKDLMSSAKIVAESAQAVLHNQLDQVDKKSFAGASADILEAGKQYGHLEDDKGVGGYVKKAEDYLHNYESSNKDTTNVKANESGGHDGEGKVGDVKKTVGEGLEGKGGDEKSGSGGGVGDCIKMAQGLFK